MATENVLALHLEVFARSFQRGMRAASESLNTFAERNKTVGDVFDNIKRSIKNTNPVVALAVTAVTGFGAAMALAVKESTHLANELSKLSERTGLSVETLSQLKFAAEKSHTSLDELGTGFVHLLRTQGRAASGSNEARRAFKELGTDYRDASGNLKTAEQLLNDVADVIARTGSASERTSKLALVMGRTVGGLVPFFSLGSEGIGRLREQAQALGLTISTAFAGQSTKYASNLKILSSVSAGLRIQIAEQLVPALNGLAVSTLPEVLAAVKKLASGIGGLAFGFDKLVTIKKILDLLNKDPGANLVKPSTGSFVQDIKNSITNFIPAQKAQAEAFKKAKDEFDGLVGRLKQTKEAFDAENAALIDSVTPTEEVTHSVMTLAEALGSLADEFESAERQSLDKLVGLAKGFIEMGAAGSKQLARIVTGLQAIAGASADVRQALIDIDIAKTLAAFAAEGSQLTEGLVSTFTALRDISSESIVARDRLSDFIAQVERLAARSDDARKALEKIRKEQRLEFAVVPQSKDPQGPITRLGEEPTVAPTPEELAVFRRTGGTGEVQGPETLEAEGPVDGMIAKIKQLRDEAQRTFELMSTGAGMVADTLVAAATGAKDAFSQFFKTLLKQLVTAIIRATILAAILSFTGLGGLGGANKGFFNNFKGFLGLAGPNAAQLPGEEGLLGRSAGSRSLAGSLRGGPQLAAAGGGGAAFTVQIHEATPRTWAEITDTRISPRLRQRRDELNEDPL